MATTAVINIVKQIKKLSPSEQQELRAVLGSLLPPASSLTEEEFHQRLADEGRLSVPSPEARSRAARRSSKPIPVRGKPVSQTIIEERR
ncbi:MAG: hypothetical protein ACRERD_25080 [Candidatus Binatia bacterium]